jgi:Trypsin
VLTKSFFSFVVENKRFVNRLSAAAHCSDGKEVGSNIYIGGTKLDHSDAEVRRITAIRKHPNYRSNARSETNDYMLMKLDRASTKPTLPYNTDNTFPATGAAVTVIGFGLTRENGAVSQRLLKANVQVDNFETCDNCESPFLCLLVVGGRHFILSYCMHALRKNIQPTTAI